MNIFFWIIDLLIPLTMLIISIMFKYQPPEKVNSFYGYRTTRSKSSQEAWDYAHSLSGKAFGIVGIMLFILIIIIKLIVPIQPEYLSLIILILSTIILILPIPYVEGKLKSKFGN
ncbi:SdpI family protein [Clostridium gasigenes]|uniref:SdpI family protein n=1 Tax=Clostridium gasigenes TaxID=94869 RepID=UPI001C0E2EE5|nr:SdpI family protein [Clostridium gasigenes]MBU3136418.1 SdpI family protein [Clostridium gasigenes]